MIRQQDRHGFSVPSPWVVRFASLVPAGTPVLDLACGRGRHARHFLAMGHPVVAVDRDVSGLADIRGAPGLAILAADLEDGGPWPLPGRRFGGVVVTNYLFRPLLPRLLDSLAPGGALIYETFARGQERFGRPGNPDFLLAPGELLRLTKDLLVVAYEHGEVTDPRPSVLQRICAVRADPAAVARLPPP